ncbi:hypothetical protein BDY19DRAFT_997497 [Irpex rosettiformis]|uniref:Uncharacterized protein n=1 Tax=Irpex rosettiformis TaxID=378272 RepID=A0ACB8TRX8_9APHY|nr:hypothetical protein BDY19DRAFT_997497 [Irpex rosettiformis]
MASPPPPTSDQKGSGSVDFDNQETLELLLQTITQNLDPVNAADPSQDDWTQMSAWTTPAQDHKADMNDFNFAFGMDLDFDPSMAVDPSALHFNTSMFTEPEHEQQQHSRGLSQLTPPPPPDVSASHRPRPLPLSRSRPSSNLDLHSAAQPVPVVPHLQAVTTVTTLPLPLTSKKPTQPNGLPNRVRQSAGVTLAVPVSSQVQQLAAASTQNAHLHSPQLPTPQPQQKLAIPRIPRPSPPPSSIKRSPTVGPSENASPAPSVAVSDSYATPPPSTTASPQPPASSPPLPAEQPIVLGISGRPKTSHTTIERRYRTNLNARITGLKQAVPALRVLEVKNGAVSPWNDRVDERGFVDGVKVARKMSKANVLGKATEYIRVLKKREARLKREQDGLKSLVSGLVGGPALLREWEREWRDSFGGEEKDEIEGDDLAAASDDEDADEGDSDADDEEGRVRKKVKVAKPSVVKKEKVAKAPPPPPTQQQQAGMPEKRKRGRPRKVPLPPVVSAPITMQPMEGAVAQQPQPTQQYLLAAFAFFSVLNSPLATSFTRSHRHDNHSHHGQVLTGHPSILPNPSMETISLNKSFGMHECVQAFHLLVSTLVFFYIVFPWFSRVVKGKVEGLGKMGKYVGLGRGYQRALLMDSLSPSSRGSPDEAKRLRYALGVKTGVVGLMQGVIKAARVDRGLEMNQLEQRAWVRLGELIAFDGSVSRATRLQTYWCMSWHVSTFATSTTDLTTLALIILSVSRSKANELWERARNQDVLRPYERLALENLSVEDAADWLAKWQRFHDHERKGGRCAACEKRTPLGVLAAILTRERLRKHAAVLFVRSVVPRKGDVEEDGYVCESMSEESYDPEEEEHEDEERKQTIDAGKSIGGRTAELAILLERIWDIGFGSSSDDIASRSGKAGVSPEDIGIGCVEEHDLARSDEVEIRTLLTATEIYRRIFPSSFPSCASSAAVSAVSVILSPPPSPPSAASWKKNLSMIGTLRAALASGAFDFDLGRVKDERLGEELEEARDRVCDMLTEVERSVRRNARS